MRALREQLRTFLFYPETDRWLTVLRIGLGLQVVLFTISLGNDWHYLFAGTGHGLISRDLAEALLSLESRFVPRFGWLISLGGHVGLTERAVLSVIWWLLLLAGGGLITGFCCRSSAILAWLLHLCAAKSGGLVSYGVDNFMTIGLFYLMWSPFPDRWAIDYRLTRRTRQIDLQDSVNGRDIWPDVPNRSELLGFWRRALQVHLSLIYFFGGLSKALGNGWWNGANVWLALTRPPFDLAPAETLIAWKHFFPVAGIAVCILEIGYPFLMWPRRTRLVWLCGIIAMHAGIGIGMGMYLFATVMIVLNLAGFGPGVVFWRGSRPDSPAMAGAI